MEWVVESEDSLLELVRDGGVGRLLWVAGEEPGVPLLKQAARVACPVHQLDAGSSAAANLGLFLQEQCLTHAYHRYGNLGRRSGEQRRLPQ